MVRIKSLGFTRHALVEAQDEGEAEERAIALLRDDPKLRTVFNGPTDAPLMFAEEIAELKSFEGLKMPGTGFAFYPNENEESEGH